MAMGIDRLVKDFTSEIGKPGVVYARIFPNGYEVLRRVDDADSWQKESEQNRIAWDPGAYCERIVKEAYGDVDDALKAADIPPRLYGGGQEYAGDF